MRIVHRSERGERVVEIDIDDPSCPIAALCAVLGLAAESAERIGLAIDGRSFDTDTPLAETNVCEGSVVDSTPTSATIQNPTPSARALAIVGGVRAGVSVPVEGGLCVGRSIATDVSLNDAALSLRHFSVTANGASLIDHGTRNGTSIEGHPVAAPAELATDQIIRAGTTRLMVREIEAYTPVAVVSGLGPRGGSIPFNRPPRREPPAEMVTLRAPGIRPEAPVTEPISVAGIVLPILAGGVMALVFSPFMAIFAALGPVLTIGTWFERRRRARRQFRAAERVFLAEMDDQRDVLPEARHVEVRRRRTLHPDPAEVVRRAAGPWCGSGSDAPVTPTVSWSRLVPPMSRSALRFAQASRPTWPWRSDAFSRTCRCFPMCPFRSISAPVKQSGWSATAAHVSPSLVRLSFRWPLTTVRPTLPSQSGPMKRADGAGASGFPTPPITPADSAA